MTAALFYSGTSPGAPHRGSSAAARVVALAIRVSDVRQRPVTTNTPHLIMYLPLKEG